MNQAIMSNNAQNAVTFAIPRSPSELVTASWLDGEAPATYLTINHPRHNSLLFDRPEWQDEEYRREYMRASIEQGVAWQIRANRTARGWTQTDLAERIGGGQTAVSRLEDPEYGCHSLSKLMEIADAFDCALLVKLVPYSTLAEEAEHLSPEAMFAAPYADEIQE